VRRAQGPGAAARQGAVEDLRRAVEDLSRSVHEAAERDRLRARAARAVEGIRSGRAGLTPEDCAAIDACFGPGQAAQLVRELVDRIQREREADERRARRRAQTATVPFAVQDAFCRLGLTPTASAAEVRQAFRALVKQLHPDTGAAAPVDLAAVVRARDAALAWALLTP
jgi:DnaJ-domain-containing protein 1